MKKKGDTPEYGNWIPFKLIALLWTLGAVLAVLSVAGFSAGWHVALDIVLVIGTAVAVFMAWTMTHLRKVFSYEGMGLMGKIHEYLIGKLGWDGKGRLLDVGCGSGALSIALARKFPEATIEGLDYWGPGWDYAREMCERNAELEGTGNTVFVKGDARRLDYPDGTFDAVVSNFVFHEVRLESDKRKLMRESLRVLRKGGCFAFHDLMEVGRWYGDMESFVEELRNEGYAEVHYEPHTENLPFIPKVARSPLMLNNLGLLWGVK